MQYELIVGLYQNVVVTGVDSQVVPNVCQRVMLALNAMGLLSLLMWFTCAELCFVSVMQHQLGKTETIRSDASLLTVAMVMAPYDGSLIPQLIPLLFSFFPLFVSFLFTLNG